MPHEHVGPRLVASGALWPGGGARARVWMLAPPSQVPQADHMPEPPSIGHGCALQRWVSSAYGHALPPERALWLERQRRWLPAPQFLMQFLVQVDHVRHAPILQWTGAGVG